MLNCENVLFSALPDFLALKKPNSIYKNFQGGINQQIFRKHQISDYILLFH